MPSQEETHGDRHMSASKDSPQQIPRHKSSYSVQHSCWHANAHAFPQAVVLEVQVEKTDDTVATLPTLNQLIQEECHLLWQSFTRHTEYCTYPRSVEVHRTRLKGVRRVVYLLRKIHAVVHHTIIAAGHVRTNVHTSW